MLDLLAVDIVLALYYSVVIMPLRQKTVWPS